MEAAISFAVSKTNTPIVLIIANIVMQVAVPVMVGQLKLVCLAQL